MRAAAVSIAAICALLALGPRAASISAAGSFKRRLGEIGAVELVAELDQRRVAPRAHIGDDARCTACGDVFFDVALGEEQRFEIRGEIRVRGIRAGAPSGSLLS